MSDLAHRVRTFGGWPDVTALLAAYAGVASVGPAAPVAIPAPPAGLPGQTGIRMRAALLAGDPVTAAALALTLDEPHRIELLLGAAIRDARGGWAAARLWLAAEGAASEGADGAGGEGAGAEGDDPARWWPVCRLLAEPGADHTLDELASAYVAEGRVPEVWRRPPPSGAPPSGAPLPADLRGPTADLAVAAALRAGVPGDVLLDAFAAEPLYPAVAHYYRRGTIHALGVRPLLVLAASAG